MDNLIGKDLGRYHILEQLGEGGMATVYKAYDTRLERNVAIKVILTQKQETDKFLKRFEREAHALAQLTHPNIVGIIDYGEYEGMPYLVMEFLPSGTLKHKLGKQISYQEAARMLAPIARALAYAHKHKIIHRDVKPANILITQSGEPMLSDFGIAKIVEAEETAELTAIGVGIGTPEYMSPEQAQGKLVDARSDVYSLGVVLFEMITGRKLYQADTPMAVVWKLASEPLLRPKQFVNDLPEAVEGVLIKVLAKAPEDRFRDITEFAKVLEKLAQQSEIPLDKGIKTSVSNRRPRILIGILSVLAVMALGTLAVFGFLRGKLRNTGFLAPLATATPTQISTPTKTPESIMHELLSPVPSTPIAVYTWEFNAPGDLQAWESGYHNDIDSIQVDNGSLGFRSFGSDPYINSPCCLAIKANETPIIEIRMKVLGGNSDAGIYFITNTDNNWNEAKNVHFLVTTDGNFHDYMISMINNYFWKGTVSAFRLDPTEAPAVVQIDYIRVRSP